MATAMIHCRPLPLSARSSHLRTSNLTARACSTGLPSPQVLRARCGIHPVRLPARLSTRLLLLPSSPSNGSKIHGDLHVGGGGCGSGDAGGGGGGTKSGKTGSGDEDDGSDEGFAVLNCIMKLIRRLLQLGESLLAGGYLATIRSSICVGPEIPMLPDQEMQCPCSSHGTHETNLMGDEGSHCEGSGNDQLNVTRDNSSSTNSRRNKYSTSTAQVGTTTNNTQDHRGDMYKSDCETSSDKYEKMMKGRRSYVSAMATSSQAGALFLFGYVPLCCKNTTIPKVWMEVLSIGYIFLLLTVALVTGHSSQFKDGELPDNAGFKLLQIAHAVVLLFLLAGLFIPLHVCRGMSNLVVWTSAAGALLMILISWSIVFHHEMLIKCIKAPCQLVIICINAPCQLVTICSKARLPNVSLPECTKAKFKEMPEEKSYPGVPMDPV